MKKNMIMKRKLENISSNCSNSRHRGTKKCKNLTNIYKIPYNPIN
jgi:hypothetical protein